MIGNTPMVDVSQLSPNPNVRILAKMEGQNPAGSVKDRIALKMIDEAEADGTLTPGKTHHRAVVGQHRHRPGHDRQAQGLPDQDRAARERVDRAPPAARGLRAPRSSSRRATRARTAPCAGPRPWPTSTPSGPSSTSTATRPTPGPTTRPPAPRSGPTAPTSPTSWPASAPAAPCMGVGTFLKEQNPDVKVLRRRAARSARRSRACATSTRATSRRCTRSGAASELLDGKRIVRPRESLEWTRRLADEAASSPASRPARRWPARCGWPSRSTTGTIVFIVCDGGWKYLSTGAWTDDLDDGGRAGREDHLLLSRAGSLSD